MGEDRIGFAGLKSSRMGTFELTSPPRSAIGLCPERPAVQDFDHRTPPARRKPVSARHWKAQRALVLSVPMPYARTHLLMALFALGSNRVRRAGAWEKL
jgi:hypothetical protein